MMIEFKWLFLWYKYAILNIIWISLDLDRNVSDADDLFSFKENWRKMNENVINLKKEKCMDVCVG